MIRLTCPACKVLLTREDREAGSKFDCPSCGQRLRVPQPVNKTLLGEAVRPGNAPGRERTPTFVETASPLAPHRVAEPEYVPIGNCPGCGQSLSISRSIFGQRFQCPGCHLDLQAPGGPAPATPLAPPDTTLLGLVKDSELERQPSDISPAPLSGRVTPGAISLVPPIDGAGKYPNVTDGPRDRNTIIVIAAFLTSVVAASIVVLAVVLSHHEKEPQQVANLQTGSQARGYPPPPRMESRGAEPGRNKPQDTEQRPKPGQPGDDQPPKPVLVLPPKTTVEPGTQAALSPRPDLRPKPSPPEPSQAGAGDKATKPASPPPPDLDAATIEALTTTLESGNGPPGSRLRAAEGLGKMGQKCNAPRITRALCQALVDWKHDEISATKALDALEKINPALHEAVILVYHDRELKNRAEGLQRLIKMGPDGKPAQPIVLGFKEDFCDRYPQRIEAGRLTIQALAIMGADDLAMAKRFRTWLNRYNERYKLEIVLVLPRMKHRASCVGALVTLLKDNLNPPLQIAAAASLAQFGDDAKQSSVKTALEGLKNSQDRDLRDAAKKALQSIWGDK